MNVFDSEIPAKFTEFFRRNLLKTGSLFVIQFGFQWHKTNFSIGIEGDVEDIFFLLRRLRLVEEVPSMDARAP